MSDLFGNDFPCCTTTPTEDTAVIDADAPADPIPAEGAPHAWVVVARTFSANADRPEWLRDAIVIPEWDHKELEYWRRDRKGFAVLPIGPDGDTGTRAIVEPRTVTTAAEADALPVGTILLHIDCPDSGPCIWTRVCAPSEVEDAIDGGTFDHIHWTVWADQETRYDGEDIEGHADSGGPLLAVYVPAEVTA